MSKLDMQVRCTTSGEDLLFMFRFISFLWIRVASAGGLVGSGVLAGAITVCCYRYLLLLLLCILVTCVAITITAPQVVWICCHGGD